jgi:hypothetical protein
MKISVPIYACQPSSNLSFQSNFDIGYVTKFGKRVFLFLILLN